MKERRKFWITLEKNEPMQRNASRLKDESGSATRIDSINEGGGVNRNSGKNNSIRPTHPSNTHEAQLLLGDCLESMRKLPDNSVDSIVTDPPYGLSFMGKKWDYNVPSTDIWNEALRVLKPGGHLLSFGGTRTYHRLVTAIEDAGFEIRDQIMWIYGQGFPKSLDISKAIDKQFGAEREVVGKKGGRYSTPINNIKGGKSVGGENNGHDASDITAPSTDDAKKWSGWGTALKPANEPICLARKPLEGTVAKNVLKWGVGGLNIDESRIGTESTKRPTGNHSMGKNSGWNDHNLKNIIGGSDSGRFPSNVILDEVAAEMLDEQSGISKSPKTYKRNANGLNSHSYGKGMGEVAGKESLNFGDSGGASRFFYVAKTSKLERGEGNNHPTVKPQKLMSYLIKLITPPNGTVLDPFMGSGSTGVAAVKNGFKFIGCELNEEYFQIAQKRISAA